MDGRWSYSGYPAVHHGAHNGTTVGPRGSFGRGTPTTLAQTSLEPVSPAYDATVPMPPVQPPPPLPPPLPSPAPKPKARHLSAWTTVYDPMLDSAPVKKSQTPIHRIDGQGLPYGAPTDPRQPWAVAGRLVSNKALLHRLEAVEYQWDKHSTGPAPPPPPCGLLVKGISALTPAAELHRHFAQFGRIAEHRLETDPRTGASLGILRVRYVDDVTRHEDGTVHERAALGGRQDGHTVALEAMKRTQGTRLGSVAPSAGSAGVCSVELDRDGSKCAAAVKAEVDRRYPPRIEAPTPSFSTRNLAMPPHYGAAPLQPGVIHHLPPIHNMAPPVLGRTPSKPGQLPPMLSNGMHGPPNGLKTSNGTLGNRHTPPPLPNTAVAAGKPLERASYTRKDDPNPPKLPPGPHLYNQGPNPHLRANMDPLLGPLGSLPPGLSIGVPPPSGFTGMPPDWSRPPPGFPYTDTSVPPPNFGAQRGPPLHTNSAPPSQARAMYTGRTQSSASGPRQQPMMLKSRPVLKQTQRKAEDDMELESSASSSDSEDEKDKLFFPRTDAAPRQHALNIVPMQGMPPLRGPQSAPLPRTTAPLQHEPLSMNPRAVAMRRLAQNGMLHLVIDHARLAGATENITEPHLRAHFRDFRPAEIFSDGTRWYLTFTTYDTARRAQLVLERKTLKGVELQARVEPPPSMAEAFAPPAPLSYDSAMARRTTEASTISPGKLSYISRSALPPSPTRRGPYLTDRELARDARNLILSDLLTAFERDVRLRLLEPRVRKVVERRTERLNQSGAGALGASAAVKAEPGGAVKLPSFARKTGARSRVRDQTHSPLKPKKPDKVPIRVSETPDADSEVSETPQPSLRRKLVKGADKVKLEEDSRSGSEEIKPRVARRLSFTSSEEDEQQAIILPQRPSDKALLPANDDAWDVLMDREASRKPRRVDIDFSDDEGLEDTKPAFIQPTFTFDPREDLPRPDPFDTATRVAEDEEDLFYVRVALERMRVGEPLHPYPEDAPDRQPEPEHPTGSARTEGYYKIAPAAKFAYLPLRNKALVDVSNVSATAVSRAARATTRRFVAGIGQQAKALTSDADVVKFNQLRTRKKQLKFARSPIHDWGLYAMEFIPAGEMICEYVGELVRQQVADKRERMYERQGIGSSYLFRLDDEYVVDATKKGSISRLINHSCTPNSTARIITIGGQKKIVIYAGQAIEPGDEVLYDYKFSTTEGEERIPCLCGSTGCRKYLNFSSLPPPAQLYKLTTSFLQTLLPATHFSFIMSGVVQTAKDAVNYVSESIQGTGAEASKEANKEVAKSSDASVGSRLSAAKDAVSDKMDETSHDAKKEGYEQKLKN